MATPNKLIPMIVTEDLAAQRDFYVTTLGFEAVFDVERYLQVRHGTAEADPELAFATSALSEPMGTPVTAFTGEGLVISVPVADADAQHRALVDAGVGPLTEPTDKPWGWRSFIVADPIGVHLDFFHALGG